MTNLESTKKWVHDLQVKVSDTARIIPSLATKEVLKKQAELLKNMPTKVECKGMLVRFDEALVTFKEDNRLFRQGYAQQNEMIRRYDEVITQKCNKHTLVEEVSKLNQDLGPKIKDLLITQGSLMRTIAEIKEEFVRVEGSVETNTLAILNHFMAERAELDKRCNEDPLQAKKIPDGVARALVGKVNV